MSFVDVTIFNVGQGNCILADFPRTINERRVNAVIDCGGDSGLDLASDYLRRANVTAIDNLIITHPHKDHILDIVNVYKKFPPSVFTRNKHITREKVKDENSEIFTSDKEMIETYFTINGTYQTQVTGIENPKNSIWGGGAYFEYFKKSDLTLSLNNLSLVSFLVFGEQAILFGADMEKEGWELLLQESGFKELLRKTTILVAPHHGLDSAFCSDLFGEGLMNPKLTIVSDGSVRSTSVTGKYDQITSGLWIPKKDTGRIFKKVLTTRQNGTIIVRIHSTNEISVAANNIN